MAKIMIVDDDRSLMENMSVFLKNDGHSVMTSDTMDGAIEKLVTFKPDLLILDVMFPDNPVAGFDLARKIRRTKEISRLPIILTTDVNQQFHSDFSSVDIDPKWIPVQDFMDKPVDFKKLMRRIDKLLNPSAQT